MYLELKLEELMEVVRTCDQIEIEECTPTYLQDFIAKRLELKFPALAIAALGFDGDQMSALCEYIRDTHALIRP
jgi:hypothetical protein